MNPAEITEYINRLNSSGHAMFGINRADFDYHMRLVEQAFYRLQGSESERVEIIGKIPKKKDHTYKIGAVYPIQAFDALFIGDNKYNTISRLQFYAKALNGHTAEIKLYMRKD